MSSYRDDRDALRGRVADLEDALEHARGQLETAERHEAALAKAKEQLAAAERELGRMRASVATGARSVQQTPTEYALTRAVWLFAPGAIVGLELARPAFGIDERTDVRALLFALGIGLAASAPVFFVLRRRRARECEADDAPTPD